MSVGKCLSINRIKQIQTVLARDSHSWKILLCVLRLQGQMYGQLKAPGLNAATGAAARIASGHQRGCATEPLPVGEGSSGQGKTAARESRGEP